MSETIRIKVIQDVSSLSKKEAGIRITSLDPEFDEAWSNWASGKAPTSDPKWKTGAWMFFEDVPIKKVSEEETAKALWNTDYWKEGGHIREFWLDKFSCSKCKGERTKAICLSCSKPKEEIMIDVLSPSETDPPAPELTPALFKDMTSLYSEINSFLGKLDKLFLLCQRAANDHGGQLHKQGCPECITSWRTYLNLNHPNWQTDSGEKGCCSLSVKRAYMELHNKPIATRPSIIEKTEKKQSTALMLLN